MANAKLLIWEEFSGYIVAQQQKKKKGCNKLVISILGTGRGSGRKGTILKNSVDNSNPSVK